MSPWVGGGIVVGMYQGVADIPAFGRLATKEDKFPTLSILYGNPQTVQTCLDGPGSVS